MLMTTVGQQDYSPLQLQGMFWEQGILEIFWLIQTQPAQEMQACSLIVKTYEKLFFLKSSLAEATGAWGVQIERVEVKDVRVPENLQRAMAAEAEAAREARAKVIAAEGEHKASRALRHAAEVIIDSPAALQVVFLEIFLHFIK